MKNANFSLVTIFLALLMLLCAFVALCVGRFYISFGDVFSVLAHSIGLGDGAASNITNVIENLRIPRIIAAILVGAALSVSGATYQGVFKNQLASPDLLGAYQLVLAWGQPLLSYLIYRYFGYNFLHLTLV